MIIKKIKSFINLFIPPIVIKVYQKIHNIFLRFKIITTISDIKTNTDTLYILGNGPSFSESLPVFKSKLISNDCIAVNNFCNTELFKEIKPTFYVIADPANLGNLTGLSEWLQKETETIANSLSSVTWNMCLIVPDFAKDGFLVKAIKNPNVKIFFFNTINAPKNNRLFDNWAENLIAPPAQTVLNVCVYLGIVLNYNEINILGMDMSWHEDLELDQRNNKLFIIDKHFYGVKKRLAVHCDGIQNAKVHEYLQWSAIALQSFWDLKAFADYKGVKIYNCSHHSWVDAFERK